jgi:hypothetical protein
MQKLFGAGTLDWRKADQPTVAAWVAAEFATLLTEEGANLLLPGRLQVKQGLIGTAVRSTWTLLDLLRRAQVVQVAVETEVKGAFTGGAFTGSIDLLVTNAKGEEAVVDLKWSGAKYRREELTNNQALQLALYAYLRKRQQHWPAQAFYLLSECRLLAQDARFFPGAEICAPVDSGANAAALWLAFEKTWKWRREQFDQGLVEVTVAGTTADGNSTPPTGGLEIAEYNDRFNEFTTLTGWQETP